MKKMIVSLIVLLAGSMAMSQDFISLNTDGSVSFLPIGHASLVLKIDDKLIYVDPWNGQGIYENLPAPDFILITDVHRDHYSAETLERLETENSFFVVPKAVYNMMDESWKKNSRILNNGESMNVDFMKCESVPMYNLPESDESPHVKGRGNGYVIEAKGMRIYISGDTGPIDEMKALEEIDVAFVCMNLPYTMDVEAAAKAVSAFKPKMVFPFHYRNADKTFGDVKKFGELVKGAGVKTVILDWYPH